MALIRKHVDIYIKDSFNVGVDLDFQDILDILKRCSDEERDEILFELKKSGTVHDIFNRKRVSLIDQMKVDFFKENFDKISIEQLQNLVK